MQQLSKISNLKSRKRLACFGFLLCSLLQLTIAQDIKAPRFFKLNIQNLSAPNNLPAPGLNSFQSGRFEPGFLIDAEMRYPVKLKGQTKIIGEFGYQRETMSGFFHPGENDSEEINLQQAAVAFIVHHRFKNNSALIGRISVKNGSHRLFSFETQSMAVSAISMYERSIPKGKIGVGIKFGYRTIVNVLPLFVFQKDLGRQWELDMLLPAKLCFNKRLSTDSKLFFGVKGAAANYYLDDHPISQFSSNNYRRINANALVGYEKQITPMVGFGFEAGASIPVYSGIYKLNRKWIQVHNFQEKVTPYAKFGFFLAIDRHRL